MSIASRPAAEAREFLREIRAASGLTQREVARRLGCTPQNIVMLEGGRGRVGQEPKLATIIAFAEVCGLVVWLEAEVPDD